MKDFSLSVTIVLLCLLSKANSQSINVFNDPAFTRLRDVLIIEKSEKLFGSQPFLDGDGFAQAIITNYSKLSDKDQHHARRFLHISHKLSRPKDTSTKVYTSEDSIFYSLEQVTSNTIEKAQTNGILRYFYKNPYALFEYESDHFNLIINPIIGVSAGRDFENSQTIFNNTRGVLLSGNIDRKAYFYSQILETQSAFLSYVTEYENLFRAIPQNGLYKDFNSQITNLKGKDYLNASGYFGYNISKSIALELGHGRHFVGNGVRSLLLSDFANNYFYFKLNANVWKFNYQTVIAELGALGFKDIPSDELLTKKYMATHYLAIKPFPWLELGLFESVIFARENQFELQYLNPIILYRSVEHAIGSPDNVLLGTNISANLLNSLQIYAQGLIDEFKIDELGSGWFGNKFGYQLGAKYLNACNINGLDVQVEYNAVRPFTYAQSRSIQEFPQYTITSYSHQNQPLAHPLGANFREMVWQTNYQLTNRWRIGAMYMQYSKGLNEGNINYGGNILLNTSTIGTNVYGYEIASGLKEDVTIIQLKSALEVGPSVFVELDFGLREAQNELRSTKNLFGNVGIRYNFTPLNLMF